MHLESSVKVIDGFRFPITVFISLLLHPGSSVKVLQFYRILLPNLRGALTS
ncbi:hypothetical protein PGB90_007989 [Kerria lacca]